MQMSHVNMQTADNTPLDVPLPCMCHAMYYDEGLRAFGVLPTSETMFS